MHILWHSNAPWAPTGYGQQTALFARLIHARGDHRITISAFYGVEAAVLTDSSGINVYPRLGDPFGNDVIEAHFAFVGADVVVSLVDTFVLDRETWGRLPWVAYAMIDSTPALPANVEALKGARWIWAESAFGEAELRKAGFENVRHVPHGVNTALFTPADRAAARARAAKWLRADLEGKFVVAMNAANKGVPSRKGFGYAFEAFAAFAQRHEDAVLAIHTEITGAYGGEALDLLMKHSGVPADRVCYPTQYPYMLAMYSEKHLNDLYNAADVLFVPSLGEGFGIPIVEAQAAGCPVIVTDFSSMPELCFAGWKVPGRMIYHTVGSQQMAPSIEGLVEALEAAYARRGDPTLRAQAREGALAYDFQRIYDTRMLPALANIEETLRREKTAADLLRALDQEGRRRVLAGVAPDAP